MNGVTIDISFAEEEIKTISINHSKFTCKFDEKMCYLPLDLCWFMSSNWRSSFSLALLNMHDDVFLAILKFIVNY